MENADDERRQLLEEAMELDHIFIFKLPQEVSSSASTDSEFWPGLRSRYPGCF